MTQREYHDLGGGFVIGIGPVNRTKAKRKPRSDKGVKRGPRKPLPPLLPFPDPLRD